VLINSKIEDREQLFWIFEGRQFREWPKNSVDGCIAGHCDRLDVSDLSLADAQSGNSALGSPLFGQLFDCQRDADLEHSHCRSSSVVPLSEAIRERATVSVADDCVYV
jgi:hypothetical protein